MYEYYYSNLGPIYAKVYKILGAQHLIKKNGFPVAKGNSKSPMAPGSSWNTVLSDCACTLFLEETWDVLLCVRYS